MKRVRKPCFAMAVIMLLMQNVMAASYKTEKLKCIAKQLPKEILEIKDSIVTIDKYPCQLIKRTNNENVVHLGFYLFDDESFHNKEVQQVIDFLERSTLELFLCGNERQMAAKQTELKLKFKVNGKNAVQPYRSLCQMLKRHNKTRSFSLNCTDRQYKAKWDFGTGSYYEFSFPAIRELIQGTDLAEAEAIFIEEMKNLHIQDRDVAATAPIRFLKQIKGTLYRMPGRVYSHQSSYTTDTYYKQNHDDKDKATAIYDEQYPAESMINLMAGIVPSGHRKLQLRMHLYGGKIQQMEVPFSMVHSSLLRQMECYMKYDRSDQLKHYARFLYNDEELQYVHVMEIEIAPSQMFNKNAVLTAHLYCFIPQHDLKKQLK